MSDPAERPTVPAESAVERRRRLAAALDEALPGSTSDDTAAGWGERDTGGRDDEWYRREVPPHHG